MLPKVLIASLALASMATGGASSTGARGRNATQNEACPIPPAPARTSLPPIQTATSIKPSDNSTSTVIEPDAADQIRCGKTPLRAAANIVYARVPGTSEHGRELSLDLLAPVSPGKFPLVVYITGGGFVTARKENAQNLRTYVAEQGFVVASVQYRTASDGANFRDGVADVKWAIRFLRAHAAEYHINPDRVVVWGESAGGYLAAMVGVTNGDPEFERGDYLDQSSGVQAVVDKFGLSDGPDVAEDFNPEMNSFIAPGSPVARYLSDKGSAFPPAANPISYIRPLNPPFLIFHGSNDRIVSPSQTLKLHNALRRAGVSSTRVVLIGAGHGDLGFIGDPQGGLPWSTNQVMDIIVRFLRASS